MYMLSTLRIVNHGSKTASVIFSILYVFSAGDLFDQEEEQQLITGGVGASLWEMRILVRQPLPPVPEHNVTLYVCPEVPDLHIKNIQSEDGTEFTVANNYLGLDPELTYTDVINESPQKAKQPLLKLRTVFTFSPFSDLCLKLRTVYSFSPFY